MKTSMRSTDCIALGECMPPSIFPRRLYDLCPRDRIDARADEYHRAVDSGIEFN